jgi:hypothetical protein
MPTDIVVPNLREKTLLLKIAAYERAAMMRIDFGDITATQCKLCGRLTMEDQGQLEHDAHCPSSGPVLLDGQPRMVTVMIQEDGPHFKLVREETGEVILTGVSDHALAHHLGEAWMQGWMTGWVDANHKMQGDEHG